MPKPVHRSPAPQPQRNPIDTPVGCKRTITAQLEAWDGTVKRVPVTFTVVHETCIPGALTHKGHTYYNVGWLEHGKVARYQELHWVFVP